MGSIREIDFLLSFRVKNPNAVKQLSTDIKEVGTASVKTGHAVNGLTEIQGKANFALLNTTRLVGDMPFLFTDWRLGIMAISNNIDPLVASMGQLNTVTKGFKGTVKALLEGLKGPAGLGLAISAITGAFLVWSQNQSRANDSTKEAVDKVKALREEYKKLKEELERLRPTYDGLVEEMEKANELQEAQRKEKIKNKITETEDDIKSLEWSRVLSAGYKDNETIKRLTTAIEERHKRLKELWKDYNTPLKDQIFPDAPSKKNVENMLKIAEAATQSSEAVQKMAENLQLSPTEFEHLVKLAREVVNNLFTRKGAIADGLTEMEKGLAEKLRPNLPELKALSAYNTSPIHGRSDLGIEKEKINVELLEKYINALVYSRQPIQQFIEDNRLSAEAIGGLNSALEDLVNKGLVLNSTAIANNIPNETKEILNNLNAMDLVLANIIKEYGSLYIDPNKIPTSPLSALNNIPKELPSIVIPDSKDKEIQKRTEKLSNMVGNAFIDSMSGAWEQIFGEANSMAEKFLQSLFNSIMQLLMQRLAMNLITNLVPGGGILATLFGSPKSPISDVNPKIIINLDGRELSESTAQYLPGQLYELKRRRML